MTTPIHDAGGPEQAGPVSSEMSARQIDFAKAGPLSRTHLADKGDAVGTFREPNTHIVGLFCDRPLDFYLRVTASGPQPMAKSLADGVAKLEKR